MERQQFGKQLYKAYKSGYHNPRPMHYSAIQEAWNTDTLGEADTIADAFDLGCRHQQNDVDMFDKDELVEEIASW